MKKSLNYSLLLVVIIAAGALWWFMRAPQSINNNPTINQITQKTESKPITVNFDFSNQDDVSINYPYNEESLFAITQTIAKDKNWQFSFKDYADMGLLVEQLGNNKNGDDQKYWQYFVGKDQPQVSVDKYFPKAGETVNWKFETSNF